jgi:transcriptional regulator with XRE-family HTH domain
MMIPDRLSLLRTKKKKTHQEMADAIGVTRPAYTAYESGKRKPDYDTLNRIVDILETTSDYLLGRTNYAGTSQSGQTLDSSDNEVYIAYLGGPKEELDEEEAAHLEEALEMFRAFREKKRRDAARKKDK